MKQQTVVKNIHVSKLSYLVEYLLPSLGGLGLLLVTEHALLLLLLGQRRHTVRRQVLGLGPLREADCGQES